MFYRHQPPVSPPDYSAVFEVFTVCFPQFSIDAETLNAALRIADPDVLVEILSDDLAPVAVCVSDANALMLVAVLPERRGFFHAAALVERAERYARLRGNGGFQVDEQLLDGSVETFLSKTIAAECGFVLQ